MQFSKVDVDLGVCLGRVFDRGADAWAIVLPGANYSPDAPLLWFAREAALAAGRNVLAVWDTFDGGGDAMAWVEQRAEAAVHHVGAEMRPLLIAKSLSSLASPLAARLQLPAVWVTPLISAHATSLAADVVNGLSAATAPSLLVGGTADATWDGALARSIPTGEVVEVADGNHALQISGAPMKSIEALLVVTEAIARFLRDRAAEERGHEGSRSSDGPTA